MTGPLGVVGASPLTIDGLSKALIEFEIQEVIPVRLPLKSRALCCLVLFVSGHSAIDGLRSVRGEAAELPIVAVLASDVWGRAALDAGASSVVRASSSTAEVTRVICSCLNGQPAVSTALAVEIMRLSQESGPSWGEMLLLDRLASGASIRAIADRLGYSERHLHRRLKRLYELLSVETRNDAVEMARRRGWIVAHVDSAWSTPQGESEC